MSSTVEARELFLYISNTHAVWRNVEHIYRNYERKQRKGTYDSGRAITGLLYPATDGAKAYAREHSIGTDWAVMFPPAVRLECAEMLRDNFECETQAGNSWL